MKILLMLFLFTAFNFLYSQDIFVDKLTEKELEKIISSRDGKILLINVWATWCIPCREEFPDLVKLRTDLDSSRTEIIGISADYPDETESKIIPFLSDQNVNFKNYVNDFKDRNALIDFLNPDWNGALPATFVFDEDGKQKVFLEGKQTYEELKKVSQTFQSATFE